MAYMTLRRISSSAMITPDATEETEARGSPPHAGRDAIAGAVKHFTGITLLYQRPKSLYADRWPHRAGRTQTGNATADRANPQPLAPAACRPQ